MTRARGWVLGLMVLFALSLSLSAQPWHDRLALSRQDSWRGRFSLQFSNLPAMDAKQMLPVAVPVAGEAGVSAPLPLAGMPVAGIRVVAADSGAELLWAVADASGERVESGMVPVDGTLYVPVSPDGASTLKLLVYYDNPSAWPVSDYLRIPTAGDLNGSFEKIAQGMPVGWRPKLTDAQHRVELATDRPADGAYCVKATADANAESSWFGIERAGMPVQPGEKYILRVRVRGEGVTESAGWFVHVGNPGNSQMVNRVVNAGKGNFDWQELSIEVEIPAGATLLTTGSVLRGAGAAWFDDFRMEGGSDAPRYTLAVGAAERQQLQRVGADVPWLSAPRGRPWLFRVPVKVMNTSDEPLAGVLANIATSDVFRRLQNPDFRLTYENEDVKVTRFGDGLLFTCSVPPRTEKMYYLYVSEDRSATPAAAPKLQSALGSDIPSDQILVEQPPSAGVADYVALMSSKANLLRNPSFEDGAMLPEYWLGGGEKEDASAAWFSLGRPGGFGARYARLDVPADSKPDWIGWRQSVAIKPGQTYIYGVWMASEKLSAKAQLHAHLRNEEDEVCPGGYLGAGPGVQGDSDWTPLFGSFTAPADARTFQMHLTMNCTGVLKHDGAFLAPSVRSIVGIPEVAPVPAAALMAWQVNPVVKVFPEDTPPAQARDLLARPGLFSRWFGRHAAPLAVSLAKGEDEGLQVALRSGVARADLELVLPQFADAGLELTAGVLGYVPIDHRSGYFSNRRPEWERKQPTGQGSTDGWAGMWPDPIMPTAKLTLPANDTRAIWVSIRAGANARSGTHRGQIEIRQRGELLATLPVAITVWNFTLPARPSLAAVYDYRPTPWALWSQGGLNGAQLQDQFLAFMADKKVSPDNVLASPSFKLGADGVVTADFSAYDQAATRHFDELGFVRSYTPGFFYLFGWAYPPKKVLGVAPYEGEHPWTDVPRDQLRPEYKSVYQQCLKLYMDHMREKGWADKIVLYISDEPHFSHEHIRVQMKALCSMIQEVEPDMPIYSSSWRHCPDWNGAITVWGAGSYGCFPEEVLRERAAAGDRFWFTTDGQMCTDTPYCAIERLLPHYCFKYDVEAYEFWGINWLTYDPWKYGWHAYISQADRPGEDARYWVRYPNGDGFLVYPGEPAGFSGLVTTIRLEAARDGVEDYEYLLLLKKAAAAGCGEAADIIAQAAELVSIPNAGGRYSTKILPDPEALTRLRQRMGEYLNRQR